MESIYILSGTLMFIFILFSLYEIIGIKKELNKIKGIVDFLLKNKKSK